MAKKTQRRLSRHERDQAGCISGFISMFDFRHGRSTKRLLADRRRVNKQAVDSGQSNGQTIQPVESQKCENVLDYEESNTLMVDAAKTSVKELMEEEMCNEHGSTNQSNDSEHHTKKYQKKRRNRSLAKSTDMDIAELDTEKKPSENIDLETIITELTQINQRNTVVEEKLVAAVKMFIEQKLSDDKRFGDEENREIMDALKTLNISKTLFLKLLKDPNSVLVKHMQNVEHISSEEKPVNLKSDELSTRKNRNFFRRKSKSMESYPLIDCQSPNKIVILKPGPGGAHSPRSEIPSRRISFRSDNMDSEKNASQFSFTEIKRKLRNAMGKERNGIISPDRVIIKSSPKHQNGNNESFSWSSPNRNHFYTERFTISPSASFKKAENEKASKFTISPSASFKKAENEKASRFVGSNLYIEAKKHLSEMVKNGEENGEPMPEPPGFSGQLPKSLGRILSFPEYNGSPSCSPRRHGDDTFFITAQMRLSPRGVAKNNVCGGLQENNYNHPSSRRQSLDSQPCDSEDRDFTLEIESLSQDRVVPEVHCSSEIEEITDSIPNEEGNSINHSLEVSTCLADEDIQKGETREVENDSDLFGEAKVLSSSPTASPSHSSVSIKVDDSNSAIDKIERPSPVSVLEPLFTDDDISPPSTISQPVEKEIQPRHIQFEEQSSASIDQATCTRISLEDEESPFEYVEAVLLGSGLNWDEFLSRWLSLHEILDSSLFDEVELFSSRPRHDQKLLFDCANEALKEICESYFGCYTGISQAKPNIQTVPKAMDLINEIWHLVEWHLFEQSQPRSLEQLINADLSRNGKWMDLQSDIEVFGSEVEEDIFNELVEDVVLSFVDNTSGCEFGVVQDEDITIEETGS